MPQYRFDHSGLQAKRQAAGLRTEHVAVATGASNEAVRSWECGRAVPRTAALSALCELFGYTPNDFFVPVADELPELAEAHRKKSRKAQGLPDRSSRAALDDVAEILKPAKTG